jgi:hypothetical protein
MQRQRWIWFAVAVVALAAGMMFWTAGSNPATGTHRADADSGDHDAEARFFAEQQAAGWVTVGRFGGRWPATPVREIEADDGIRFVRANGTPHHYSGFDGYRMKAVFLRAENGEENIVVFRSRDRRSDTQGDVERG